jgi:hypothetical protein
MPAACPLGGGAADHLLGESRVGGESRISGYAGS